MSDDALNKYALWILLSMLIFAGLLSLGMW